MKLNGTRVYRFDQYVLEVAEHRLKRGEVEISLQPKAFETLVYLVERHGHLVKKNELMDAVWRDVAVSEGALTLRIKEVRQALEDDAQRPRYIKTLPTVGYKFIADVKEITETDEARGSPVSAVPIKAIAVIPFKPLVAEHRNEALEMGMAESLITRLSNVREVIVRPLSAVRSYTTLEQDAVAAGREQGVDAVIDGSIQRSGERIRVTVRLTTVQDRKQLWTDQFDETFTNVFSVQDLISERVVDALALELTGEERTLLTKHSTQNNEAYDAYLWGRHFWAQDTPQGLTKGIGYFRRALEKDPNFALAYTGLADSYILLGSSGLILGADSYRQARDAAAQALTIDEGLGEAHVSMGSILADHYWEWAQAEKHFKRAIELIPNDESAHNWYSQYLARTGRIDEAILEAKLALKIAPTSRQCNHTLAFAFYFAGRYREAIEQSEKTLELDPNFPVAHALIGMAHIQTGMYPKAILALQRARQLFNSPGFLGLVGYGHAMAGKNNEARSVLEELRELSKKTYVPSFSVAIIYLGLGENNLAYEWLEQAARERDTWLGSLKVDPIFISVRSDPQFTDLLRQVEASH